MSIMGVEIGYAMMPLRTTCGCATSKFPALSSEECCGFRRVQDSIKDSQTTAKVAKYNEVVDMAIEATFTLSFGGSHTPRMCLLRSVSAVQCRSPERDWDISRWIKGWGLGEWRALLPYDGDSEDDLSDQ